MHAGIELWGLAPLVWGVCLAIAGRLIGRAPAAPSRPTAVTPADALRRAA
jgi:hypothetical protein